MTDGGIQYKEAPVPAAQVRKEEKAIEQTPFGKAISRLDELFKNNKVDAKILYLLLKQYTNIIYKKY